MPCVELLVAVTYNQNNSRAATIYYCILVIIAGSDFDETGFDCIIEYYYDAKIKGVTKGIIDENKLQSTLVAARFFNVEKLATEAKQWAAACGVTVDTIE
jgi:hypothetical protein